MFDFDSLADIWEVLEVTYKNLNKEDYAREALKWLRQNSQQFGVFLVEFQHLHNLSMIIDEKTSIPRMRKGVTPELGICVGRNQDIYKAYTFDEYIAACKYFVIRLELE